MHVLQHLTGTLRNLNIFKIHFLMSSWLSLLIIWRMPNSSEKMKRSWKQNDNSTKKKSKRNMHQKWILMIEGKLILTISYYTSRWGLVWLVSIMLHFRWMVPTGYIAAHLEKESIRYDRLLEWLVVWLFHR